jgi:hypothetical protein
MEEQLIRYRSCQDTRSARMKIVLAGGSVCVGTKHLFIKSVASADSSAKFKLELIKI